MSRRVSLPGADELFRSTQASPGSEPDTEDRVKDEATSPPKIVPARVAADLLDDPEGDSSSETKRGPSGRVRHDEKITVYVTADELLDLERTRLVLRGNHRLAVDRGRIVREAIHLALEGVQTDGEASALVQRLREQ